ncbi:unnamed protein product, partial [Thlaspi arvense]
KANYNPRKLEMDLVNDVEDRELLHSHAHIVNHIFNFINSMSLKCAVQLGIPDVVNKHGRPMTLSELIAALSIKPSRAQSVFQLMRMLVHSGFFLKQNVLQNDEEEEGYLLAPVSRLLLKDDPLSLTPFLLAMLDPIVTNPWHHLSEWFQSDDPTAFATAHGRTIWEHLGDEPKFNLLFNEAMASDAGGTGAMAKSIAEAFPHLKCSVLDLPRVVAGLQGSKNLEYVAGDMFEAIPRADAVLLKWVLHSWNDEQNVKVLKRCKEAIPSKDRGGKVIIIEMVVENQKGEHKSLETQLLFDMLMMIICTGRERTEKEWAKLFFEAGFSDYKITPILGLRCFIEVYP